MSKFTTDNKNGFTPFANGGCKSVLKSARKYTLLSSMNGFLKMLIWVLTKYLLLTRQWMYIQLRFQYVYFVSTKTIKQNYQTLYFELAHNKFSYRVLF